VSDSNGDSNPANNMSSVAINVAGISHRRATRH
jgi:hypothetical protein